MMRYALKAGPLSDNYYFYICYTEVSLNLYCGKAYQS